MPRYALKVEYDGRPFAGWQRQADQPSVQGALEAALARLDPGAPAVYGAGRTDAGVHAVGQVAHVKTQRGSRMKSHEILRALNDRLPSSVAVLECEEVPARFHARHSAVSRAYFYQISTRKAALSKKFVWWIKEPLDVAKMQQAAALIAGRHDFQAFRAADKSKPDESTIVVVESAEVGVDDHLIVFRIEASHFLWKMVRRLAGTLVKVGLGEVSVEEFGALMNGKRNPKLDIAAWTAPASGLFLDSVRY
jgi:tRNA pseudouridine38-40 synthase